MFVRSNCLSNRLLLRPSPWQPETRQAKTLDRRGGGGLRGRFLGSRVTVTSVVDTIGGLYVFAARAIATRQETQSSARPLELNFSCTVHATEKYATTDRYRLIERR